METRSTCVKENEPKITTAAPSLRSTRDGLNSVRRVSFCVALTGFCTFIAGSYWSEISPFRLDLPSSERSLSLVRTLRESPVFLVAIDPSGIVPAAKS